MHISLVPNMSAWVCRFHRRTEASAIKADLVIHISVSAMELFTSSSFWNKMGYDVLKTDTVTNNINTQQYCATIL